MLNEEVLREEKFQSVSRFSCPFQLAFDLKIPLKIFPLSYNLLIRRKMILKHEIMVSQIKSIIYS